MRRLVRGSGKGRRHHAARLDVVKAGDLARLSKEEWDKERGRMEAQCVKCHATATVKAELAKGDEIVRAGDRLKAAAKTTG